MKETSKADCRRFNDYLFKRVFKSKGIDIGAGDDCLENGLFKDQVECECFDLKDGDAEEINKPQIYDFVYSSNCLEHLHNPSRALANWLKILKPNGFLIFSVSDEDLYEQGVFPSKWNEDHKWTFTIKKRASWSFKSLNIIDLISHLNVKILRIQLVDSNYDYSLKDVDQTLKNAEAFIEVVLQKNG